MRGYKAFDKDLRCRGMQYEVGGEFTCDGPLKPCFNGIHFCERMVDVYRYYDRDSRICEVEALGNVVTAGEKSCTDRLRVVRELSHEEMEAMRNTGDHNTGIGNTGYGNNGDRNSGNFNTGRRNAGYDNTGDGNTGDRNIGDYNTGYYNTGDRNTGYYNTGDRNTGYYNAGDHNTGVRNTGYYNTGYYNTGYYNAGNANTGYYNAGNANTGDYNVGHCNVGAYNVGYYNAGDRNVGHYNVGNYNTGDWNITDRSAGVLCTEEPEFLIFDKPSGMTLRQWRASEAAVLMGRIRTDYNEWVHAENMSEEEKRANPDWETCGGYLRQGTYSRDYVGWWDSLTDRERDVILAIPNFDAEKWKLITGIEVD